MATEQASALLAEQLGPVLQRIAAAQQQLQQRMPKPQLPPEVQASLQIAQMDTQRKAANDQGVLQLKQAELQAQQQFDGAKLSMQQAEAQFRQQMEQAQQQFENYISQMQLQQEDRNKQLVAQVEMMRNEQDNHQKQMTELLKNRDDNDTKMMIEEMKAQLNQMQQKPVETEKTPDMTPMLKELQMTLDQLGKQQTNDALAEVMNGLRATIEHLGKPKMIIRDQAGRAAGIQ